MTSPTLILRLAWVFAALLATLHGTGCQLLGGMQVEAVASSSQKPSNVAVYVAVEDSDGPVTDLDVSDVTVIENGLELDSRSVGLTLLPKEQSAAHHVLVLVDLSGPIAEQGALQLLANQLAVFLERLRADHGVSVFGFDGADQLTPLGNFAPLTAQSGAPSLTAADLAALTSFAQRDPSSNLNGAVVSGLHHLELALLERVQPVRIGSMVVIARGPDLAGRTSEQVRNDALDKTSRRVYAVTVGKVDDTKLAQRLGPSGHHQVTRFENLEQSFAEVARLIEDDYKRHYLISYCSPSRAGKRTLMVRVNQRQGDGSERQGDVEIEFDASSFEAGCDPLTPPKFEKTATPPASVLQAPPQGATVAPATTPAETPDSDGATPVEPDTAADTSTDAPAAPDASPESK